MKIACRNISKNYGPLEVLGDITVETEEHDFVCILGPNGCGKTTLLKIMAGILKPSAGEVAYPGSEGFEMPVCHIFQEHGLFPWLNVIDNICFQLEMKGVSKPERHGRAAQYLEEMGLMLFKTYYPHQLSVGMKQKIGLIRGLLSDSPALLIDEADVSLDVYAKSVIQKDIRKIWEQYRKTVIHVTHDVAGALQSARHIWMMSGLPAKIIRKFDLTSFAVEPAGIDAMRKDLQQEILDIFGRESLRV